MILELDNVSFRYPLSLTGKRPQGLEEISLQVQPGECFGFLGHNGAGKTTTIKCILNLLHPSKGTIRIDGVDNRTPESRARVGYLPEQPYFYDHLTVEESIIMYARLAGVAGAALAPAVDSAISRVRISDRKRQKLRSLSKGLVQRVALAQAIVASPKLLVLDEPFSGLDPIGRKEFRTIFLELQGEGVTLFISSHVLSDIERLCDRVSIMANGKLQGIYETHSLPELCAGTSELVVIASPEKLAGIKSKAASITEERGAYRITFQDRNLAEQSLQESVRECIEIVSYTRSTGTLEDLFTSVVKAAEVGE